MSNKQYAAPPALSIDLAKTYTATIETVAGTMELELYAAEAPMTVNNFVFLAREGFYDNVIFHRVIKGFMIQGGDPTGTGMGGPGYKIRGEFGDRSHVYGTISMARSQDPNSAGSQFFICHGDAKFLDKQYASFGMLTKGSEVLDAIAGAATVQKGEKSSPVEPIKITSITITEA
jgi:cyclophilin family peptidyl-prolyl cis-trans isomerase